jgi:bacterioferritin (cytochrome b1)
MKGKMRLMMLFRSNNIHAIKNLTKLIQEAILCEGDDNLVNLKRDEIFQGILDLNDANSVNNILHALLNNLNLSIEDLKVFIDTQKPKQEYVNGKDMKEILQDLCKEHLRLVNTLEKKKTDIKHGNVEHKE